MFFVASKVLWFLVDPVNLALLGALAAAFLAPRFPARGRALAVACVGGVFLAGLGPFGKLILRPLEDRFPPPPSDAPAPYGIVVLGGGIDDLVSEARGQVILNDSGSRLTEAALLARRFPTARIVYSGGDGGLIHPKASEAEEARDLLVGLGVEPKRIAIETRSRNTDENARFTAAMVQPKPGEVWWLVTSAFHMPRAMGLFEKAGFDVLADPVGYRTTGDWRDWTINNRATDGLTPFEIAAHEWAGLVGYRMFGKTDAWFPGPGAL